MSKKVAELVAGPQTDALVALTRDWELEPFDQLAVWINKEGQIVCSMAEYSPSTNPTQWVELIPLRKIDIRWVLRNRVLAEAMSLRGSGGFIEKAEDLGLAICKAVIAAKWGDEIPNEIWEKVA